MKDEGEHECGDEGEVKDEGEHVCGDEGHECRSKHKDASPETSTADINTPKSDIGLY